MTQKKECLTINQCIANIHIDTLSRYGWLGTCKVCGTRLKIMIVRK
jgi:hypothetical protein